MLFAPFAFYTSLPAKSKKKPILTSRAGTGGFRTPFHSGEKKTLDLPIVEKTNNSPTTKKFGKPL